jgi:DNA phosphorothioation-dependent restriction protein DptG
MNKKVSFLANLYLEIDKVVSGIKPKVTVDDVQFYGNEEEKVFTALVIVKDNSIPGDQTIEYDGYSVNVVFTSSTCEPEEAPQEFCTTLS